MYRYKCRGVEPAPLAVRLGGRQVEHQVVLVQLRVPGPGGVLGERGPHPVPGLLPLPQLGPGLGARPAVVPGAHVPGVLLQERHAGLPGPRHDLPHPCGRMAANRRAPASSPRCRASSAMASSDPYNKLTVFDSEIVTSQYGTARRVCARASDRSSASRPGLACGSAAAIRAKMSSRRRTAAAFARAWCYQ